MGREALVRWRQHAQLCCCPDRACRIIDYKDTGTAIIGGADEIQALLDDQIVKVQAMRASPYIKSLEKEACQWEALLMALQVGTSKRALRPGAQIKP